MSPHVTYPVRPDGTVDRWLACGPLVTPLAPDGALAEAVTASGSPFGERGRWTLNYWAWDERVQRTKARIYQASSPGLEPIDDAPAVGRAATDAAAWRYLVLDDATADFSRFSFTPALFSGHLYAEVVSDEAATCQAELLTVGPAHLWLDGRLVHSSRRFGYVHPRRERLELELKKGVNRLWLRGDMIGLREARLALGLRWIAGPTLRLRLPIGSLAPEAWHEAERCLQAVQLRRAPGGSVAALASVVADAGEPVTFAAQAELTADPAVQADLGTFTAEAGASFAVELPERLRRAIPATLGEGAVDIAVRPVNGMPLERRFQIAPAATSYSEAPYGSYASRRREATEHLARMTADVLGSAAAVRLGESERLDPEALSRSLRFLDERRDTADFHALGLLAAVYWFGDGPALPAPELERVRASFRDFKYWLDEPGLDAMCYFTENHQILFHTVEYLAAQRWPQMTFRNSDTPGAAKLPTARARILAWIDRRLRGGFSEWDSNAYLAMDAFALLALVEFAEDAAVTASARALVDKLFFMLASQSFRGTQGCTHGRCYVGALKSGRNEATSGLQRIAWGMGSFNGETRAPALLAMSERYRVPEAIQAIGADLPEVLVTHARALGDYLPQADMRDDRWDVRTLTRRTPHYQLAAALDHRPGAMGIQEHLWQATLGPEAAVFTTYPGNRLEHGEARPNLWAGSALLPHVGMHERTVLCLYRLDATVGLGYTHAYFPVDGFDAWRLDGPWAFARRGDGYVALWADGPLSLTEEGRSARHELRSAGPGTAWLCTVGSAPEDGTFERFTERILTGAPPAASDSAGTIALSWRPPQGNLLALGWQVGLRVDGTPLDTAAFPHYRNRYTHTALGDRAMAIEHGGLRHVIELGARETAAEAGSGGDAASATGGADAEPGAGEGRRS